MNQRELDIKQIEISCILFFPKDIKKIHKLMYINRNIEERLRNTDFYKKKLNSLIYFDS